MELHSLKKSRTPQPKTRVGRGSKRGKTAGRGTKGQKARAGNKRRPEWRDIIKKLPKRRGYGKNRGRTVVPKTDVRAVSLSAISKHFNDGDVVTGALLAKAGLVGKRAGRVLPVKVLGGEISKKLTIEGLMVSASAKAALEKAGGKVQ